MFSNRLRLLAVTAALLMVPIGPVLAAGTPQEAPRGVGGPAGQALHTSEIDLFLDRRDIQSLPDLVDSLLSSIASLSNYDKPGKTPQVSRVSRAHIESTICRGKCTVQAWYLPDEGIFLEDSLQPETNLVHRSILLHELIHFVQDLNAEGASMNACERWLHREREAYRMQNEYLARLDNGSGYHLMVGNQIWITTHRNACAGWKDVDETTAAHAPQGFGHGAPGSIAH